ncbi:MAG: glycerol kinase GlpK [Acidimicrobiales bacterium]|jgi:glycerol kinase
MAVVVAIDAGTTGVRALAVDEAANVVSISYRELTQYFPRPGWVEHDAGEIFDLVEETLAELTADLAERGEPIAAVGITNQRETAVAWDRSTGQPLHRAIVWQDRRTAERCRELEESGQLELVRSRTGLVLDSYFSASKWEWMFRHGDLQASSTVALGTVDDWVTWKLTGRHATDPSNASRTMCFDLTTGEWSAELCDVFRIDPHMLGELVPSSGRIATITDEVSGGRLAGIPISGIAGDQQSALFGQHCVEPGQTKVTYGTGSFVLMNLGPSLPAPTDGLLTTVAWKLGETGALEYALEGAVFSSGATIQWLRDGLGIIDHASEVGPLAETVASGEGVFVVPAFTGLGSPWWDPHARGTIVGLTRGTGRAHLARATVEAMAFQTRDVLDAMQDSAGVRVSVLRADGGAAAMDLLLQLQADQCGVPVVRPATTEVTALGAAFLAGIAEGVWTVEEVGDLVTEDRRSEPVRSRASADADHARWLDALARSRNWD